MLTYQNANQKEAPKFVDILEMKEKIRFRENARILDGLYIRWLSESKTAIHTGSNIRRHLVPEKIDDLDFHTEIEYQEYLKYLERETE